MRGLLICIEGINGSGEKTNAAILAKRLEDEDYKVRTIAFPDYTTPIGHEIRHYLEGKRSYGPEVRQLLYVANRWERKEDMERWLRDELIVVADRYTPSGLAYGFANGLELDWMINLERGLPPADLTVVIDVSVDTHFRRVGDRDVYEEDRALLERVRSAYSELAGRLGWVVINGERGIDEVAKDVWEAISRVL